jgi:hypothetical protein
MLRDMNEDHVKEEQKGYFLNDSTFIQQGACQVNSQKHKN